MNRFSLLSLTAFLTPLTLRAEGAAPSGGFSSFVPLIIIMVLFYFLLIRPQQKQAKEQQQMLGALKKGDRVLTQGGLYAVIVGVKGKSLEVKLNDEVKVLISRAAVSQVVQEDPTVETPEVVAGK